MSLLLLALIWLASMAAIWHWPAPNPDLHRDQEYGRLDWIAWRRASRRYAGTLLMFCLIGIATAFTAVTWFESDLRSLHCAIAKARKHP